MLQCLFIDSVNLNGTRIELNTIHLQRVNIDSIVYPVYYLLKVNNGKMPYKNIIK